MADSLVMHAPQYGWLFPLLGIVFIALAWYAMRLHQVVGVLAHAQHRSFMIKHFSWLRFGIRLCLVATALLAIWLALLRPQYRLDEQEKRHEYGRDVVIAVDISRNMLVEDCSGASRLVAAQKKIIEIAQSLASDRVALLVFSGAALVLCPLTKDMTAFRMFVDSLDTEVLGGSTTTSLSAPVRAALQLFSERDMRKHKLVVLFTDGEDFSHDFADAQREAERAGLEVSVVGVGSAQGGPIPLFDDHGARIGHQRDAQGEIVISRLNEQKVKQLVSSCGGLYIHLDEQGGQDSAAISSWIQKREREQGAATLAEARGDLYMFCSGWAVCALAMAWMI